MHLFSLNLTMQELLTFKGGGLQMEIKGSHLYLEESEWEEKAASEIITD